MIKAKYQEIEFEDIKYLLDENLLLLVTATDTETDYTHHELTPIGGFEAILKVYDDNFTYYFGMFGLYKVAHVQCEMGSISRSSSIMTVSTALNKLKSKAVMMIGIAFGVDHEKQNIGDVLISESIIPYNSRRVGNDRIIHRGQEATASQILLNRFRNMKDWEYVTVLGDYSKLIFTRLLSGEELIDNKEHRDQLIQQFPDSKGGEMEGAGVYAACGNKIDWIIVKGICDFADGEKGKNKQQYQEIAIKSALSVCSMLFNSFSAFKDLKITPLYNTQVSMQSLDNSRINDVLFDYYDSTKKPYYILRDMDENFNLALSQYGVWVFGPSGCGKSNLIMRNIIQTGKEFIQINLAPCIGQDIESFFKEILYELSSKINGVHSKIQPANFAECTKELITLLKYYENKELIIFIEEIPISSSEDYEEFTQKIFSLIISKNFKNGLGDVKFVLSSIENPSENITSSQKKIHQNIRFIGLEYWIRNDIERLINLVLTEFQLNLSSDFKIELIESANGSPRFIKKFFRSLYTLSHVDDKALRMVLLQTKRELQ